MKITASEMYAYIGKTMRLAVEGTLLVPVKVLEAKQGYGTIRLLVEPVGGEGQRWVESSRIR